MNEATRILGAIRQGDPRTAAQLLPLVYGELRKLAGQRLAEDGQKAVLVKLRNYAGLSVDEAARRLGISRATAARQWAYARAWLYDRLRTGGASTSEEKSADR